VCGGDNNEVWVGKRGTGLDRRSGSWGGRNEMEMKIVRI
jgi:hypothetical protein